MRKAARRCVLGAAALLLGLGFGTGGSLAQDASAAEPAAPLFWQPSEAPAVLSAPLARLRVLTADGAFPFNSVGPNGPVGFNVDLARALCRELRVEADCTVSVRPFADLERALLANEGDAVIAGLPVTAGSRARLRFTQPYFSRPARFAVRREDAAAEPVWRALKGAPVGVVGGSAQERFLRAAFPDLEATSVPDDATLFAALAKGQVRAVFADGLRLAAWLNEATSAACCRFAGGPYLAPEVLGRGLAIAVRPDDAALQQRLDDALEALGASRTMDELYFRWFPVGFF